MKKGKNLRPEPLWRYFAPEAWKDLETARLTFRIDFKTQNFAAMRGNLQASAVYTNIPDPVEITEAEFRWRADGLDLRDFTVKSGKSTVRASSVRVETGTEKSLKIESAAAELELELERTVRWAAPLLLQFKGPRNIRTGYKDLKGRLSITSLDLQGPLLQPGKWTFKGRGAVENLAAEIENPPAPLRLKQAQFHGTEKRMAIELKQLSFLGSLMAVSGTIEDPLYEKLPGRLFHIRDDVQRSPWCKSGVLAERQESCPLLGERNRTGFGIGRAAGPKPRIRYGFFGRFDNRKRPPGRGRPIKGPRRSGRRQINHQRFGIRGLHPGEVGRRHRGYRLQGKARR